MAAPTIDQFLTEIASILRSKDGSKLQDYLILEPPLPPQYTVLVNELRQVYSGGSEGRLELKCKSLLPDYDEEMEGGVAWTPFVSLLVQYFTFLRDVNVEQLVETHDMLKGLLK